MPERTKGRPSINIISSAAATEWVLFRFITKTKTVQASPAIVSSMPPVISHFQAMIRIRIRKNDGIRWVRKARIFCINVRSGENESSANRLRNNIAKMQMILGSQ
jgi:hypothetical protein